MTRPGFLERCKTGAMKSARPLGWLCALSIALLYARLFFSDPSRLYSHTPVYRWQAIAFLRGQLNLPVDFSCAGVEMILYKGRFYYYWPPLPSFVQAGYIWLTQNILGRARYLPESVLAFLLVCGFGGVIFAAFSAKIRAMGRGPLVAGAIGWAASLAVCAFSIFFDLARYKFSIFEESVLYGTVLGSASVLTAYLYVLRWYQDQSCRRRWAMATSGLCAAAILCRPNYIDIAVLLAPWMIIPHLKAANPLYRLLRGPGRQPDASGWGSGDALRRAAVFLAPTFAAGAFLLLYNYARFNDPFNFGFNYLMEMRPTLIYPSEPSCGPFLPRWVDPLKAYFTGWNNPLFFPHLGSAPGRIIQESRIMDPPFTFERVQWILFPLVAALAWHAWSLFRRRNDPALRLTRLDGGFLLLGAAIILLHVRLTAYFPQIAYRYVFAMFPAFLVVALAGLGFRRSYLPVTCLLAAAFVADAPHYLRIWATEPNHYLMLNALDAEQPTLENPARTHCPFTTIPASIACGARGTETLHEKAHLGWDAAHTCEMASSTFLVFSVGQPGPDNRWRLDLLTDERAVGGAQHPTLFVQGQYVPLQERKGAQPGFFADFTLSVNAETAKALPVVVNLHPYRPFTFHAGKLYQVQLAGLATGDQDNPQNPSRPTSVQETTQTRPTAGREQPDAAGSPGSRQEARIDRAGRR